MTFAAYLRNVLKDGRHQIKNWKADGWKQHSAPKKEYNLWIYGRIRMRVSHISEHCMPLGHASCLKIKMFSRTDHQNQQQRNTPTDKFKSEWWWKGWRRLFHKNDKSQIYVFFRLTACLTIRFRLLRSFHSIIICHSHIIVSFIFG